jgi:hypothetical protein
METEEAQVDQRRIIAIDFKLDFFAASISVKASDSLFPGLKVRNFPSPLTQFRSEDEEKFR